MTATRDFAEKAVYVAADYIRDNIATYLRAAETRLELDENSLTDPAAVIEGRAPLDNRSPRYEVYVESGDAVDERSNLHGWDVTVAWTYIGDANIETGERFMMRQYTALRRLLEADYTMGGELTVSIPRRVEFEVTRGDSSASKHEFALGLEIHTHDP